MNEQEVKLLIEKYNRGLASPQEKALLENWYLTEGMKAGHQNMFPDEELDLSQLKQEMWKGILKRTGVKKKSRKHWIPAAAALILLFGLGIYLNIVYRKTITTPINSNTHAEDILPGGNKATLALADGRTIDLSDEQEGLIITSHELTYSDGTSIAEVDQNQIKQEFNTITTPKGGQYKIVLPDGSKVWLNAASTLQYPSKFDSKERRVILKGEAFFQVATLSDHAPFIVQSPAQEVKVLGTQFNIKSYKDERNNKTTLFEGKVSVSSLADKENKELIPGQQSIVQEGRAMQVVKADLEEAIAWKNGEFVFYNESIEDVMKEIARWYDVEVIYQDSVQNQSIWGSISKFKNISEVLKMIEYTGTVKFELKQEKDERRVYVMK